MGDGQVKRVYRRHLPHFIPEGFPIFVTWNLKGALPRTVQERLCLEQARLERQRSRAGETTTDRQIREQKILFAIADFYLDTVREGPLYLKVPTAANIVESSILFGAGSRYELFAWCVMANHVHVLFKPTIKFSKILQGMKGYTDREINRIQNTTGRVLWQDESYDHFSRDDAEFLRIIEYVENNPVKAGLCSSPGEWRWSSARHRPTWPTGQPWRST
jgi:putative DNA methylase